MATPDRNLCVLIVDDDANVLQTFGRMLRVEGYRVLTASDVEAALHLVEQSHPDIVLLDLRMPLADGVAFLRRLRAREGPRRTPVAVVTGDYLVEEALEREMKDLGADLYYKPLWIDDLVRIVYGLLHPRRE